VGLASLPRQAWVWPSRRSACDGGPGFGAWVEDLPLARLLDWLADALRRKYEESEGIGLNRPIPLPDELGSR